MKHKVITSLPFVLALTFSLVGCGKQSDYQVSKKEYKYLINPETVFFSSNYTVNMTINNQPYMTCALDNGKMLSTFSASNNTTYYESTLDGDNVTVYSFSVDNSGNQYENTYHWSKDECFSYFCYHWYVMFDIPFDDITYNSSEHRYEIKDYSITSQGTDYYFDYGYIYFENKLPKYVDVNIQSIGVARIEFSNFGTTVVEKPQQQAFDPLIINLSYTCDQSQQNDIMGWIGRCLTDIGCRQYELSTHDNDVIKVKVLNPVDNTYSHNLVRAALLYSSTPTMTNAHDRVLTSFMDSENPAYVNTDDGMVNVIVPIKEASQNDFVSILEETRQDIELNRYEYGVPSQDGDSEETNYNYEFYFWSYFDSEICAFANHYEYYWYSRLLTKTYVTSDDSMFFNGQHYALAFPVNQDLDANGVATTAEQAIARFQARVIARLFNNEPNDFGLYLTGD